MSKLSYKIQQAIDEIDGVKYTGIPRLSRIVVCFVTDLWYDYPHVWIYNIQSMYRNLRFFMPHIKRMRNWDSSYQIALFCDSLAYLAEGLKNGHCLNSEKKYRRCLFAGQRLRNAYDDHSYQDKSYARLAKRNPIKFVPCGNGMSEMTHNYGNKKEYYEKMFALIHKRTEKVKKENKDAAWAYINKHIESFWD